MRLLQGTAAGDTFASRRGTMICSGLWLLSRTTILVFSLSPSAKHHNALGEVNCESFCPSILQTATPPLGSVHTIRHPDESAFHIYAFISHTLYIDGIRVFEDLN